MTADDAVTGHYSLGGLRERIQAGLTVLDETPTVDALGAVDEFHIGGRPATMRLIEQMDLGQSDHVLDIGSGLGGMARSVASTTSARVTGVDLTAEYVEVATWLTELVGLTDRIAFIEASANDLAAPEQPFTAATMVHVGMNIADKAALFERLKTVLAPGSTFAIYDIMGVAPDAAAALTYPTPWARSIETSYLATSDEYTELLTTAGFTITAVNDRSAAAMAAFQALASAATKGPAPLGLHLVMGPETPTKIANMIAGVRAAVIAPTEVIAHL